MPDQPGAAIVLVGEPRFRRKWTQRNGERRRRRVRLSPTMARVLTLAVAILLFAALYAFAPRPEPAPDRAAATEALTRALVLFGRGNVSGALTAAQEATNADRNWGLAHAFAARLHLAQGDGDAAEAAIVRARRTGFAPERTQHLLADAWLLQGDPARAIAKARQAPPRYAAYATRVRARAAAAQGEAGAAQALLAPLLDHDDAAAWADLGTIRRDTGDIGGAIDATARAGAINPAIPGLLVLKGTLVRSQYGLVAALPWFEAADRHDPADLDALVEEAATLGDLGRAQDMLAVTRRAIATDPADPRAYYLQAVLAARAGRFDLARVLLQKTGGTLRGMPAVMLLGGMLDYHDGAYEQAIGQWRALAGTQSYNLTARRLLGAALLRAGDAKGALDVLRPVALRADADRYTLTLVARAFEAIGERDWAGLYLDRAAAPERGAATPFGTEDSLAMLAAAAEDAPGDPQAAVDYVRGLIETVQPAAALVRARQLAQAASGAPAAHLLVGDVLAAANHQQDAAAAYARAADLRFDAPTALRLVTALDRAGRRDAAAHTLGLYLAQNPESRDAQRLMARWQLAAGDWDDAIATLERLRARTGDTDAMLLAELGSAHLGRGDMAEATRLTAAAHRLAPLDPAITDAYGWALFKTGRRAAARQLLRQAVATAPDHPGLRAHLAQATAVR
ncbi:tetratricopeptide repeat protein [Hephaestia sp. GCM10023244]|uniref:tetratricopeptide repeat protein n=1 Tax=unclassified Hephaestia TaxID=2631281 RepID=UPI0020775C85|nr:tetratricopeptide repeat protein [Hephaestia sp. MAHUQ-44]MCM8730811.1 tetratricopeptide repeat protein [Hephaestia sp. MAHUQ-44]